MPNIKISELSDAGTLTGAELVEAVQSGVNVRVTLSGIREYIYTGVSALALSLLADQEPEDMRDTLGAAAEQHEHDIDDVDGLSAALSSKINASEKAAANGVATLGGDGKIPSSQLPPVAITETFVVNSQAAMLALDAQEGDVAVRTDLSKSYILQSEPASELENWQELLTPSDAVISVNGQTGAVSLTHTDVGAQQANALLSAVAGLSMVADRFIYGTGAGAVALGTITSFARSILDDADAGTVRTTIGAAASSHSHAAGDITSGTLAVARGGTGIGSYTAGNYLRASGATTLTQRTPAQVLGDIGAETLGELGGINTRVANYTLVLADKGKTVEMNLAGANTLTVPPNSSVAFPVGSYINVVQLGTGATTIVAGSGVTINSRNGLVLGGQYAMATLYKRGTNEWVLGGDLTP